MERSCITGCIADPPSPAACLTGRCLQRCGSAGCARACRAPVQTAVSSPLVSQSRTLRLRPHAPSGTAQRSMPGQRLAVGDLASEAPGDADVGGEQLDAHLHARRRWGVRGAGMLGGGTAFMQSARASRPFLHPPSPRQSRPTATHPVVLGLLLHHGPPVGVGGAPRSLGLRVEAYDAAGGRRQENGEYQPGAGEPSRLIISRGHVANNSGNSCSAARSLARQLDGKGERCLGTGAHQLRQPGHPRGQRHVPRRQALHRPAAAGRMGITLDKCSTGGT